MSSICLKPRKDKGLTVDETPRRSYYAIQIATALSFDSKLPSSW
jgi:hypothetical protein